MKDLLSTLQQAQALVMSPLQQTRNDWHIPLKCFPNGFTISLAFFLSKSVPERLCENKHQKHFQLSLNAL